MKNYHFLIMATLLILSQASSMAAVKLDFTTVDMLTYRYYQEKKWDSVIVIGKQALRQEIDYYYLRVRLGIAYFEKTDYFPASTHLKKAMQFNSGDPVVAGYLYRAYVYTNRQEEADLLRAGMAHGKQDTILTKHGFLEEVHFETGYTVSSDRTPENLSTLMEQDSIYGEQDLYGNSFYANLAFKLRISNRVRIAAAYNYLNFDKTRYIQYGHAEAHRDTIIDNVFSRDYFYSYPWTIHDTSFNYHVFQHEGHLSASITGPAGIRIMPAIHLVHVSYSAVNPAIQADNASDTAYYSYIDSTYHLFRYPSVSYSYQASDTSFNNWVVSLGLSRDFGIFRVGLNGSWSNLNNKKQGQAGISLSYFPLGNLDFYGTTTMTGFFQGSDKRLLVSQVLGAKITPWMWGEANFYYGDYTNANIFNGSVVYNNSDIIDFRAGATLVFTVGEHLQLSINYQYFRKESRQLYYIKTEGQANGEIREVPQIKTNPYYTNTLIGGITWKL